MKKTLYMIAASLLLFFVLAFMDEYETLILPLFKEEVKTSKVEGGSEFTEETISRFLRKFNKQLSDAYGASNPGKAWELPASPELQRSVHDELVYNLTNKIKAGNKVSKLFILQIETLSPASARVIVLETTEREGGGSSEAIISYVVEKGEEGLFVRAMEYADGKGE